MIAGAGSSRTDRRGDSSAPAVPKPSVPGLRPSLRWGALLALAVGTGCGGKPAQTRTYPGANLVMVVIDTLRADHLGCYGYFRETSPGIDAIAARSLVFTNAVAQIPQTLPSHACFLTGLYPQTTGVLRNWGRLDDRFTTLAEKLKAAGYRTGAVVGTAVLKKQKNLGQGFDAYIHNFSSGAWTPENPQNVLARRGDAGRAVDLALDWLRQGGEEPFFLFMNLYDVHGPYPDIPEPYSGFFDPEEPEFKDYLSRNWSPAPGDPEKRKFITDYDRAVAWTDSQVARLYRALDRAGALENTVFIVTSDHGEELYQHHDYPSHGLYLYDAETRIPLIVRLPGMTEPLVCDAVVETVDLFPTIAGWLELDQDAATEGANLLETMSGGKRGEKQAFSLRVLEDDQGRPYPRQFSVRTGDFKVIHAPGGATEMFETDTDPSEKRPLPPNEENLSRAARLLRRGREWFRPRSLGPAGAPDPETAAELRALGYLR